MRLNARKPSFPASLAAFSTDFAGFLDADIAG
jgi:hypothetical protein